MKQTQWNKRKGLKWNSFLNNDSIMTLTWVHDQLLGWITKCPSWNERKHEAILFGIKLNKILKHEVNAKMSKHLGGMKLECVEVNVGRWKQG